MRSPLASTDITDRKMEKKTPEMKQRTIPEQEAILDGYRVWPLARSSHRTAILLRT
jgi:hypothetical protein